MNDGDWYKVSWNDQSDAAGYVDKAIGTVQSELDGINSETNALLGQWEDSDSQAAYRQRQETWTKAATDIMEVLAKFKTSLVTSAGISSDTEAMNATTMAG